MLVLLDEMIIKVVTIGMEVLKGIKKHSEKLIFDGIIETGLTIEIKRRKSFMN